VGVTFNISSVLNRTTCVIIKLHQPALIRFICCLRIRHYSLIGHRSVHL
jgi:hypothetical protein